MPIYEFKCKKCGLVVEKFVRNSKNVLPKCPTCDLEMDKLISSPASIIFKGSGYYTTDYGKGKIFKDIEKKESSSGETKKESKKETAPKKETKSSLPNTKKD